MNCSPAPLPTFLAPDGSKAGPPFAGLVEAAESVAAATAAAAVVDSTGTTERDVGETAAAALPPKPQPVLPFCVEAPRPEQIPVGFAQHVL